MRDVTCCEILNRSLDCDPAVGFISACWHVYRAPQIPWAHYNATPDTAQINTLDSKVRQDTTDDRQRSFADQQSGRSAF